MDYTIPAVQDAANYQLRLRHVKNWLIELKGQGANVADLDCCIEILQSVSRFAVKKFGENAKIDPAKIDVEAAWFSLLSEKSGLPDWPLVREGKP